MNTLIMRFILKKHFVVRLGKTCTDAIALYIDIERKRGKNLTKQNMHQTRLWPSTEKNVAPAKKEEVCPRVVQTFRLGKKQRHGGEMLWKKQSSRFLWTLFFQSWSPWNVRTLFLFTAFPPCLELSFLKLKCSDYSRTKILLFAGARVLDTH